MIKVLALEPWMKRMTNPRWSGTLQEVPPIYNRDGYYYDGTVCWFEVDNKAFAYDKVGFLYTLELLNAKILSDKEVRLFNELAINKLASKKQLKALYKSDELKELRNIVRSGKLIRMRVL